MNHLTRKDELCLVILVLDRVKTVKVMSPGDKMGQQWGWGLGGGYKGIYRVHLRKKNLINF